MVGTAHDRVSDRGADRERALDGLRAVAVIGVLCYHAGVAGFAGGSVGVDLFFVLSGFLITRLLLREHTRRGRISLGHFWERRARRLLPALGVLLLGVAAMARWAPNGLSPKQLRGDSLATLFYFANWHFIFSNQGYFAEFGAKSPLLHTWSLGVEEQFYLVWPLVVAAALGGLAWVRHRRKPHAERDELRPARRLLWVAGLGTVGSALLMASMHLAGFGADRLYYGTDTRAQALLAGATLAALLAAWPSLTARATASTRARLTLAGVGWAGAAGVGWALHGFTEQSPSGYLGEFLGVAVAGAVLTASVTLDPDSVLARILSLSPLVGIGRISYGLYLYHWPLFLLLTTPRTGLSGAALLTVRLAATLAVSIASYYLIERPVRTRSVLPRRWAAFALPSCTAVTVVAIVAATTFGMPSTQLTGSGQALINSEVPKVPPPGRPVRTLIVGDSIGLTLQLGLIYQSQQWGVTFNPQAELGCDLDPQTITNIEGTIGKATQGCPNWRTLWPQYVRSYKPDVALVVLGRWEEVDRLYDGKWVSVGDPLWDQHLIAELDQVIDVLSAGGAHVELATLPYIKGTTTQPNGQPWDIDTQARVNAYNADVRAAVAKRPQQASVLELNRYLDPGGHYTDTIRGIPVRWSDKEHISIPGGLYLRGFILPVLHQAGVRSAAYQRSP